MYNSILVPVDGSDASKHAVKHALELAADVDASVHILHVVSLNESRNVDVQRIEQGQLINDLEVTGDEIIEESLPTGDTSPVSLTQSVMFGRPDRKILKHIRTESPDLVIMGSRGRTGVQRMILGSVAENVARRSSVPVQLIP
ncbi:universal stress protein [Natronococcus sp. A-GB1]|uniref:universal stress protein n=1 Tax=Natronococcus sp. A-GB1 TaxID=3037648 RepID=UPI00241DD849|nr:universal stress protein [Natronococcus sp. A-GB1]MDG5762062.1 universal stress protein [Natronococcus sp. A-GB1]